MGDGKTMIDADKVAQIIASEVQNGDLLANAGKKLLEGVMQQIVQANEPAPAAPMVVDAGVAVVANSTPPSNTVVAAGVGNDVTVVAGAASTMEGHAAGGVATTGHEHKPHEHNKPHVHTHDSLKSKVEPKSIAPGAIQPSNFVLGA